MRTKISIALLASAALAGSANASITWYLQLNGTNLSSEVFQVVTTGNLVNGQAAAGSYTIQSVVSGSGQSAYVNLALSGAPYLGYASANGMGFDWNGSTATGFWSWYQSGPFTQSRQDGFQIVTQATYDLFTVTSPYGDYEYVNTFAWTFGTTSSLQDTRFGYSFAGVTGGTNITGGTSIVSLTNPVPAPGAIALLGLAGLAGRRRR
ncbi:MAG: hypothetical protein RL591_899 [Planctomycetota bacterium]|jgi:MYXO-CTERM domain-containing protein